VHESVEFRVVIVAVAVLALGSLARAVSRRTGVPFSGAMLVSGVIAGFATARIFGDDAPEALAHVIHSDLILFVFLPALVFESAFALDAHAFWKERSALGTLAVPALLVNAGLVAGGMVLVTGSNWAWTWPVALVFGALISATDPVAVVALLRDVGAPKRLGLLIEGESLLNDGTSIVIFGVVLAMLATGADLDGAAALFDFLRVVLGGVLVGVTLAGLATLWLTRTFNDPLVEIPLTLVLAYAAMVIAEGLLHVSGVIAVVTCGLWLGGRGRTALSPEVREPLAHFWHLLAHIANTLIFFLVGMLIASQLDAASWRDLVVVLAAFALVVVTRIVVTFGFRPLINVLGGHVSVRESLVMSWSGLRGAVSLALALMVCQHDSIAPGVQRDILLAAGGVVLLTILINGGTAGALLRRLGFQSKSVSDALAGVRAEHAALARVAERIDVIARARDMKPLDWREVRSRLQSRLAKLGGEMEKLEQRLSESGPAERAAAVWVMALRMEREAYWDAFADGTLGARAVRLLNLQVDRHLDRIAQGDLTPPSSHLVAAQRDVFDRLRAFLGAATGLRASRLALLYDVSRGDVRAAERVLTGFAALDADDERDTDEVVARYRARLMAATQSAEEMRVTHPELVRSVERRLAQRVALNLEREEYGALTQRGLVEDRKSVV
jgi:NhaP-type Na+/H+ or K+/H+ antiporter